MSVAVSPDVAGAPTPFCVLCGRPMDADQEWCLECGAARTVIARPPDWRVPILVIGAVVLVIAGLAVLGVSQLGGHATKITVAASPSTARPTATIATWQPGLDGYTVLLRTASTQAAATGAATRLLARHVADVGVLNASQHPQLHPRTGRWEVFSGRYPTYAIAQSAATAAVHHGQPQAVPALVQRPGQG